MTSVETINRKIQMLPSSSHKKVIDFIDDLLQTPDVKKQGKKVAAWEEWANSNSQIVVVQDDSRETIYED